MNKSWDILITHLSVVIWKSFHWKVFNRHYFWDGTDTTGKGKQNKTKLTCYFLFYFFGKFLQTDYPLSHFCAWQLTCFHSTGAWGTHPPGPFFYAVFGKNYRIELKNPKKQECTPVGWVPSTALPVLGESGQGGVGLRGVSVWGCLPRGVSTRGVFAWGGVNPPVERMTDACENITWKHVLSIFSSTLEEKVLHKIYFHLTSLFSIYDIKNKWQHVKSFWLPNINVIDHVDEWIAVAHENWCCSRILLTQ